MKDIKNFNIILKEQQNTTNDVKIKIKQNNYSDLHVIYNNKNKDTQSTKMLLTKEWFVDLSHS